MKAYLHRFNFQFLCKGQWTYGPTLSLAIDTNIRYSKVDDSIKFRAYVRTFLPVSHNTVNQQVTFVSYNVYGQLFLSHHIIFLVFASREFRHFVQLDRPSFGLIFVIFVTLMSLVLILQYAKSPVQAG